MGYKITIIIPVYNAEKTLERAIDSIINQSFDFNDIELILIDDNSNDGSREIINKYSEKYENVIKYFLEKNSGGPSKPRNIAIEKATGKYLMFMDNDDKLDSDYCETLFNAIDEEKADVVRCRYSYKFLDGVYSRPDASKERTILTNVIESGYPMWASIFNTKFIQQNNIRCPLCLAEDGYFTIVAYTKANKIIYLPNYYGYIHTVESEGVQSLGHTTKLNNFERVFEGYDLTIRYLEENNYDASYFFNNKIPRLYNAFFKFVGTKEEKIQILSMIRDYQLNYNYQINVPLLPWRILNNFVLNKKWTISIFICRIASVVYNHRNLKNFIFKRNFNLKFISKN
ncbi:MAG: glycosyltransferase family 2 protein [Methanobrevibacter thaueri]|nr:glycosyltransferase family 2 protein [Methanobrevibacter thaueri]